MSHAFCQLTHIDELDAVKITHPLFSATLLLQGAQLIEFTPIHNQGNNLLWLSDCARYEHGKPIRGGIPICWPWFGNLDKNPDNIQAQLPDALLDSALASAHGFARTQRWQIKNITENCHFVEITLQLTSTCETKKIWPFEFSLDATFTFSKTLAVSLTTTNQDTQPFYISQALHSYLPTVDIKRSVISPTQGLLYIDALDHWQEKTQTGKINFRAETDRLYFFEKEDYSLRLDTPNNSLLINNKNSQSAVIWNPWIEKSKRLSQFREGDYQNMLCIETANVLSDVKKILPQEQSTLTVEFISGGY